MTKIERIILNIYHQRGSEEHYNIKILIEFENKYLLFNSHSFIFINKADYVLEEEWKKLNYDCSIEEIFLERIREDELTSYFLEFSNSDILYISQKYNGETWWQEFEVINKRSFFYKDIHNYMYEEFVEEINLDVIKFTNTSN